MWKLLLIAFLARVNGAPSPPELPRINCFNLFGAAVGTGCPPSPISSNQNGSSIDLKHQPMPFGISNTGANFYQNFVLNGAVLSGHSNSEPPKGAPKRNDYTYTPGVGAHKLNRKLLTWNAARKACNEEGGHLAIINSDEEAQLLAAMIDNSSPVQGARYESQAYVGIHDLYAEDDWVTIFGVSLANTGYKKWSNGVGGIQPNNIDGIQHCGTLKRDGGLNDVACEDVLPYFCELTNV